MIYVEHIVHPPIHLEAWPDESKESNIILIVRKLDPDALKASLKVFNGLAVSPSYSSPGVEDGVDSSLPGRREPDDAANRTGSP